MKVRLIDIFWLFVKTGCFLFGGGYVILPLLETEAVEKRGWLTTDELVEYYVISQFIPGLNAPDVSMFIGYKLRGKLGALVAGAGIIFVPFLLIVSLAAIISKFADSPLLQSIFWGVGVGVIILVINAIQKMWVSSIIDRFTFILFLIVLIATISFDFAPAITVFSAMLIGLFHGFVCKKLQPNQTQAEDD